MAIIFIHISTPPRPSGYMSAMSVCRSPAGTYACAVAGAPVTSWDGYDTHYTGGDSVFFIHFALLCSVRSIFLILRCVGCPSVVYAVYYLIF
jgi:hypothetical protein